MEALKKQLISVNEYLEQENKSDTKYEYYNGETFAMAGASFAHNLLVSNLIVTLTNQLRSKKKCKALPSDLRIKTPSGLYTYPDVSIICGKEIYDTQDKKTIINPTVIIEVLSDSTEKYDRGEKFSFYRKIESLKSYALINHKAPKIEMFSKNENNLWYLSETTETETSVIIPSIECTLNLEEVYYEVLLEDN